MNLLKPLKISTVLFAQIVFVFSMSAWATNSKSKSAYEPISEAELKKALGEYQNVAQMDVLFKQKKTIKDMDLTLAAEGELHLKFPGRVTYQVNKPARLVVTMTPDEIKFENGSGSSATTQSIRTGSIAGDSDKRNMQAMVTWLKMDSTALAKEYSITTDHGGHFVFHPRDMKASPFRELEVEMGATGHVRTLTMHEQSGDRIDFIFETPKIVYAASKELSRESTENSAKRTSKK